MSDSHEADLPTEDELKRLPFRAISLLTPRGARGEHNRTSTWQEASKISTTMPILSSKRFAWRKNLRR